MFILHLFRVATAIVIFYPLIRDRVLRTKEKPSVENEGLRLQVFAGQEPRVRDLDGVRGAPCTVRCHRRLLRRRLLRDTSPHQDSASTFWPRDYAHLRRKTQLEQLVLIFSKS